MSIIEGCRNIDNFDQLRLKMLHLDTEKGEMGQLLTRQANEICLLEQKIIELDKEHTNYPWWVKFLPRGIPIPELPIDRVAVLQRVLIIVFPLAVGLLVFTLLGS